jgi:hypothetical protein
VDARYAARGRQLRAVLLVMAGASALFLIPWIVYLSDILSDDYEVHAWRVAWVGFDAVLVVCVGWTAILAWQRRQLVIPWAIITATLLCCDAWFDVVLDWGTSDELGSIVTAAIGELPLAALLFFSARRLLRLTLHTAWQHFGMPGRPPKLPRMRLMALGELPSLIKPALIEPTEPPEP